MRKAPRDRTLLRTASGLRVVAIVALMGVCPAAWSLNFYPTELEWATWPEYCRARYMESAAGRDSEFAGRVTPDVVARWRASLGEAWDPLHHYCAGLAITDQARVESDRRTRELLFRRVLEENKYVLPRIPPTHPMYAEVAARTGLIYHEIGENDLALQHLDKAIEACPGCPFGYQAKAMFYRKQAQLTDAQRVLKQGNEAVEGRSAEIHYFLGLVSAELNDFEMAQAHARLAYGMGYPLPGLKNLLAKEGHPLE